ALFVVPSCTSFGMGMRSARRLLGVSFALLAMALFGAGTTTAAFAVPPADPPPAFDYTEVARFSTESTWTTGQSADLSGDYVAFASSGRSEVVVRHFTGPEPHDWTEEW